MDDAQRTALAACNLCEAICGLELTIEDRPAGPKVVSIRGNPDDPLSRGHICPKGVALADVYEDPDRLRRPVKQRRRRLGRDLLGRGARPDRRRARATRSTSTAATPSASTSATPTPTRSAPRPTASAMIKSFRTRNKFSASSVDQIPHQFVAWQLFGHQLMIPIADIDRTSYFLVFGANPMASNGSLMTVPDFPNRLRELKKRGGRMVVFDPRRTETAKVADEHHFVRPGTDAVVLLAMVHVLLRGGADRLRRRTSAGSSRCGSPSPTSPRSTPTQASGVPADVIRRITREFAAADGAAAYGRIGLSTQGFGSICQWAIQCLNILTGNFDREGGVLFPEPAIDIVGKAIVGRGHHDVWRSRVRGARSSVASCRSARCARRSRRPARARSTPMLTVAGNPVLSTPDGKRLGEAFDGLDFMAAVDIYLNETTRHADVVLPPTTALERDQYDLVFHALAVRNTARFTPAVFDKPEGAHARLGDLPRDRAAHAARLDKKKPLRQALARAGPAEPEPDGPWSTGLLLTGRRTTMRALRANPAGVDLGPLRPTMPARLQTRDKLIHLAPDQVIADLPRLRDERSPTPAATSCC